MGPDGRKLHYANSGVHGQTKKAGTSTLMECFGVIKCPGNEQGMMEKGASLQHLNVTCCSLCPHYNKIIIKLAVQINITHHAPTPGHFQ